MSSNTTAVVSNTTPSGIITDGNGQATFAFLKWMQGVGGTINGGFDPQGNYQGPIGTRATIAGRKFLATILQHLSDLGVIDAAGLPSATTSEQGAVLLPAGAQSNTLGTAAIQPTTAFDYAGAANQALTAAKAYADTTQANAQAFASNASNLTSGTVPLARLGGLSAVITTAALTSGGTQGSMTFVNGLLIAQVQAT